MRTFKPDFILISASFDAMRNDLLGLFDITPKGFAAITRVVVGLAGECCLGVLFPCWKAVIGWMAWARAW